MAITRKTHWFVRSAAVLALAAFASGAAEAGNFELTYDLTVNQGSPPFASLTSSGPLPAGTKLTFTAKFNTDSANQWNIGAWIYTAFDETVVIRAPSAPPTFYSLVPVGLYEILLSDPSWATFGGPAPYSAGLIKFENGLGSINSVFDASTQPFVAETPSDTMFYEYDYSFYFTGAPFVVPVTNDTTHSLNVLSIFDNSVSGATASIEMIPEPSTWAMMLLGFAGLGFAGYRASRRTAAAAL